MKPFILSTDSGCDLSDRICRERDVHVLHMRVLMDGEVRLDTQKDEDTRAFYNRMREGSAPLTSQINPEEYIQLWKPLLQENLPIVHISMGSAISGSYFNAVAAADMLKETIPGSQIHVVDSTVASTGYGLLVLKAADMRDAGSTPEECVGQVNRMKPHVNAYYTTGDLTWLQRGGRISRSAAAIGTLLHIHPIMNLDLSGHLQVWEKARGSKAALRRIASILEATVENPSQQTLYVSHADNPAAAKEFADELKARYGFKDVCINYIGAVIGTHTGPGLITLFWLGKARQPQKQTQEQAVAEGSRAKA